MYTFDNKQNENVETYFNVLYKPKRKTNGFKQSRAKTMDEEMINFNQSFPTDNITIQPIDLKIYTDLENSQICLTDRKYNLFGKNMCTICREEYDKHQNIIKLPCKHYYHSACILTWLKQQSFCPLCHYELPCEET